MYQEWSDKFVNVACLGACLGKMGRGFVGAWRGRKRPDLLGGRYESNFLHSVVPGATLQKWWVGNTYLRNVFFFFVLCIYSFFLSCMCVCTCMCVSARVHVRVCRRMSGWRLVRSNRERANGDQVRALRWPDSQEFVFTKRNVRLSHSNAEARWHRTKQTWEHLCLSHAHPPFTPIEAQVPLCPWGSKATSCWEQDAGE